MHDTLSKSFAESPASLLPPTDTFPRRLTERIVTEADPWEELRKNVRDVVRACYFDAPDQTPRAIRLHLTRDEVFACA